MSAGRDYGPVRGDEQLGALAKIVSISFGIDAELARAWLAPHATHARIMRENGHVVGGLLLVPMGQFFGGRRVSSTGIAGVGILPSERGRGTATALMQAALAELSAQGTALSVLFPATMPLYRRAGYEIAGGHYRIRVAAAAIGVSERALPVRPADRGDTRTVERLYRTQAVHRNGWLDRPSYVWDRVRNSPKGMSVHGHLVEGEREPEGYVFYRQEPLPGAAGFNLLVTDMAAATPRAARRLLGFLSDHRSMAGRITWHGGVDDAFVALLPERGYELSLAEPWMLRLVDTEAALRQRGYPKVLDTRLELEVHDPLLSGGRARFRVDISGGKAEVRRGGRGAMVLDGSALAALYSGHLSPQQLALAGRLEATPSMLARAAAAFAGPAPSLPDFF
ncbi:GNAT family N-acetyltransferase [Haliangium ochraceum]|uniref:GCN5-related N-acetyltransferase n=1 Tax=Haliangium ochraceum (strain DSM 14365 / JCM 11303 / SMP-2) TaxID=502025 RepID=D0LX35_HALO1|nr:GNAT family N-acetyltransferase [Haliangium ochraceum]ACY16077.1 GCN5-related N-acetyltransferase [Haliangium ochraceum DSM 14365]